jgi:hypothetical protein
VAPPSVLVPAFGTAQDQIGAERGASIVPSELNAWTRLSRDARSRRADHGDIGVRRDLEQGDAARDDEQHHQRHFIGRHARRGYHAQSARRHDQQADDERLLVADPLDQFGRRDRGDEIGDEPDALDQGRLRVGQIEHAAQVRQQRVVDDRDEAPHEEQAGEQAQRRAVALLRGVGGRGRRALGRRALGKGGHGFLFGGDWRLEPL